MSLGLGGKPVKPAMSLSPPRSLSFSRSLSVAQSLCFAPALAFSLYISLSRNPPPARPSTQTTRNERFHPPTIQPTLPLKQPSPRVRLQASWARTSPPRDDVGATLHIGWARPGLAGLRPHTGSPITPPPQFIQGHLTHEKTSLPWTLH